MHNVRHAIENESETFTVLSQNNPLQITSINQIVRMIMIKIK